MPHRQARHLPKHCSRILRGEAGKDPQSSAATDWSTPSVRAGMPSRSRVRVCGPANRMGGGGCEGEPAHMPPDVACAIDGPAHHGKTSSSKNSSARALCSVLSAS